MAGKTVVEFIEEWQTGFFLVIGTALVGVGVGVVAGTYFGPPGTVLGIVAGAIVAFAAFSYLLYGR